MSGQAESPADKGEIVSEYLTVTQEKIDAFAELTGDNQWIHTDPIRAAEQTPYKSTIAHGFLILSLFPTLLSGQLDVGAYRYRISYGFKFVRFLSAVRVNSLILARARISKIQDIPRGKEVVWDVSLECKGAKIPACLAEWIIRYYN
jgi:acyl dehydratase